MTSYLIGIDDTDNLESRGTGYRVRQLAGWLLDNHLADPRRITRHQLLVDARIPYTSHNSSACLVVDTEHPGDVWEGSREFLKLTSAYGSDAGLCLAAWDHDHEEVLSFGQRAKSEVLTMTEALQIASRSEIRCEGLTGTGGGIIGALAGIGLHRGGNDGRFLWLPGLRELNGECLVGDLLTNGHIDRVCTLDHVELSPAECVHVGDWVRPVLRDGKSTLYVEEQNHGWHILSKEHLKNLSN
jgi:hypothetical protein